VAKRRWAKHCTAHRTDGTPCGAWSITGGSVCRSHGGAAPQTRRAAHLAYTEARIRREFEAVAARRRREWINWQAKRVATVALLLGIPVTEVREFDIWWCRVEYGVPAPAEEAPEIRPDRRFKLPPPPGRKKTTTKGATA